MDRHHGNSGTYIVKDGERVPATPDSEGNVRVGEQVLHRPVTRPHDQGDAPRDAKGQRIDRDAAHEAQARPQPAFPEPATPPWLGDEKRPAQSAASPVANDPNTPPRTPRAVK